MLVRPQDGVVGLWSLREKCSQRKVEGGPRTNFRRPRSLDRFRIFVYLNMCLELHAGNSTKWRFIVLVSLR